MLDCINKKKGKKEKKEKKKKNKHVDTATQTEEKKESPKNKYVYCFFKRTRYIIESFTKNYIFWITYLLSIVFLSLRYGKENYSVCKVVSGFLSCALSMIFGWWIHMFCHYTDFTQLYDDLLNGNTFISKILNFLPNMIHRIIKWFTYNILDFHDKIHHDSSINRQPYNLLMEAFQNTLMQGIFIIFSKLFQFEFNFKLCFSETMKFNCPVILLWSLLYMTIHLINYRIIDPNPHQEHHLDCNTNYGIDTIDIIFNTKYNIKDVEDFNHGTINVILIMIFIIFFKEINSDNIFVKIIKNILD